MKILRSRAAARLPILRTTCRETEGPPAFDYAQAREGGPYMSVRLKPDTTAYPAEAGHDDLEETDGAPFAVDVDVHERRRLAEPGHTLHLAAQRDDELGAGAGHETANGQDETGRPIAQ